MSLDHLLLGLLRQPASGWDLRAAFERSLRYFWSAELSQIYPVLARMERRGLLTSKQEPSSRGPARRVYTRTARGRKELLAWLEAGPDLGSDRIAWLGQLFFHAEVGDLRRTRALVEGLRDALARKLAGLRAIEARWRGDDPRYPDPEDDADFCAHLTLTMGLASVSARLAWAEASLRSIDQRLARAPRQEA